MVGMADFKFEYEEELLSSCANSALAAFVAENDGTLQLSEPINIDWKEQWGEDESCSVLHQQHARHYGNPLPKTFQKKDKHRYLIDDRLRRFLNSLLTVYYHNSDPDKLHRLALNQFADSERPYYSSALNVELEASPWESFLDWDSIEEEWVFSPLEGKDVIEIAANLTVGHGGMGHLHHTRTHRTHTEERPIDEKIKFPEHGNSPNFAVPIVDDPELDGDLLKVKPRHHIEKARDKDYPNPDYFAFHLDWSTHNNPDGVSIVKNAFDQGECGSCWAFAAAGSLEASASRRQAREAYGEYLQQATARRDKKSVSAIHREAKEFARDVEVAAFEMANLSIQELIDCDTAADQGCVGGNPLLAFYFIHRYGLTTWSRYPYVGYEDVCHKKLVSRPVAKVKSWGIVSPNYENDMELVLRYIGPIAVGVNGAEQSFLAYHGGIFDKPNCRQGANHALLITGYGQEEMEDGRIVRYWIARNSWGRGWGEHGYIRVRRGDGLKGTKGVCGIARSPSVALGGMLLANRHSLAPYHTPKSQNPGYTPPLSTSSGPTFCSRLGFDSCGNILGTIEDNKALFLGLTGIFFAAILTAWPLTLQCRRRRRLRRQRELRAEERQQMAHQIHRSASAERPREVDPLLGDPSRNSYGA